MIPRLLASVLAQVVAMALLHAAVLGELVSADSDPVNDAYALFQDALAEMGDAHRAWKITLSAMLQHPKLVFY